MKRYNYLLLIIIFCSNNVVFCQNKKMPIKAKQSVLKTEGTFYNVKNYGAIGDGKSLDSPAINRAIEACAHAGGGTVYFPAGIYLSGSIRLKSYINLFIDAGATILGAPQEMNAYDPIEPFEGPAFQDGGHTYFHNSLIWGENLTNVSITGLGMINGGGLVSVDGSQDNISGFSDFGKSDSLKVMGTFKDTTNGRLGNKAIALKLCRNIVMKDFTIFHGGHFAILTTGCEGLTIDNVVIDTNRDGIDIDCCCNVVVSNCRVNSPNDDAITPKSSFALSRNFITENLTITNCQVSGFLEGTLLDGSMVPRKYSKGGLNGYGRIKLGTEANGGFRNITISNCTFRACRGLALQQVDGGIMENITINNLAMIDIPWYAIYIVTGKRNRGPNVLSTSSAKNIIISNVVASGIESRSGIQIFGMKEQPIEGLRLENIWLSFVGGGTKKDASINVMELGNGYPEAVSTMPAYGIFARHVSGLELANIRLGVEKEDLRPAMICEDINGLDIDNFKAEIGNGVKAAIFKNVTELDVRNSHVINKIDELENDVSVRK